MSGLCVFGNVQVFGFDMPHDCDWHTNTVEVWDESGVYSVELSLVLSLRDLELYEIRFIFSQILFPF